MEDDISKFPKKLRVVVAVFQTSMESSSDSLRKLDAQFEIIHGLSKGDPNFSIISVRYKTLL